ncbi:MAG: phage virion morphogenesis protein, partial [Syntrophobacteraceae bacterium]
KGGLTLVLSGSLRQSIAGAEPQVTDRAVKIGTNKVYARIHHFGGVVETGPRRFSLAFRKGKDGKLAGFMSRSQARRQRKGSIEVRSGMSGGAYIPIPARPFLLLQTEDIAEMRQAAIDYLAGR